MSKVNLLGEKFGRLRVVESYPSHPRHGSRWKCVCDCGNIRVVLGGNLSSGNSRSCGCMASEMTSKRSRTHGRSSGDPTYSVWAGIIQRCENSNSNCYERYGGRGIQMCDRWNPKNGGSFENFLEDMGEKPSQFHTIERTNNNKGYSPENCIWTGDVSLQAYNKRVYSNSTSGVAGVNWDSKSNAWRVRISKEGKRICLGYFISFEDAVKTRREAEIKYFGFNKGGDGK